MKFNIADTSETTKKQIAIVLHKWQINLSRYQKLFMGFNQSKYFFFSQSKKRYLYRSHQMQLTKLMGPKHLQNTCIQWDPFIIILFIVSSETFIHYEIATIFFIFANGNILKIDNGFQHWLSVLRASIIDLYFLNPEA